MMIQAVNFWKQMQEHCKSLAEDKMRSLVEKAMNVLSDEKQLKFWTTISFKKYVIRSYAIWIALNVVSSEYFQIKVTQKEYLKENPTYEECRRDIHKLTETFLSDLKRDQKVIADKQFEPQKKIENLKR